MALKSSLAHSKLWPNYSIGTGGSVTISVAKDCFIMRNVFLYFPGVRGYPGYSSHHWCNSVAACSGSCCSVEVHLFRDYKIKVAGERSCFNLLCGRVTGEQNQPTKASAGKQHKCFLSQKVSHSLVAHIGKLEWSFNKQSCYLVVKWCHFSLFPGRHGNFSRTKGGAALSKEKTKAWHKSAQMKTLIVV